MKADKMLKAKDGCCEEAALGFPGYIPCNKPATKIIQTKSKTEGPYRMCDACADHSVRNRGMKLIGPWPPQDTKKAADPVKGQRKGSKIG